LEVKPAGQDVDGETTGNCADIGWVEALLGEKIEGAKGSDECVDGE
jgi:hypothetical protein